MHSISGVLIPCCIVAFLGADGGAIGASSQAKSPGVGNADRGVYSSFAAAHDTKQHIKRVPLRPIERPKRLVRILDGGILPALL